MVGCVAVEVVSSAAPITAELKRLAVADRWRRRGLGMELVRTAEAFCRERGVALLTLTTLGAFNPEAPAHAFYLRAGYSHVEEPAGESRGSAEAGAGAGGGEGGWGVSLARFRKKLIP